MDVPEHLWRHSTREAIDALAERFQLPNHPNMQDWEYEVADPKRVGEFAAALASGDLTEDEQFTLMGTILQSFEESDLELDSDSLWRDVLSILDRDADLHANTIWYWSCLSAPNVGCAFRVSPSIREILAKHRTRWENPNNAV